jgi:outer membrane lipoprotein-sorting protein
VLFRERGGVEVEFRFGDWQLNPPLPDSFFHFTVPLGVAIVNGDSSSQSMP